MLGTMQVGTNSVAANRWDLAERQAIGDTADGASTMQIIALYVTNPDQLQEDIALLLIPFATLCFFAYRMKLSVAVAAVLMLVGCGIAIGPDILSASRADLGDYGDWVRKLRKTNDSDGLIAIASYMRIGYGKLLAFAGMSAALICHTSIAVIRRKLQARTGGLPNSSDRDATSSMLTEAK